MLAYIVISVLEGKLEKISNILGKPIISIYDGMMEGYIKNILVDKKMKKVVYFCIFNDESQEEKLVNSNDIYSISHDSLMIKNNENISLAETIMIEHINPIGFKVFDLNGNFDGKIVDILFDDKFEIEKIFMQEEKILDKKNILNVGNNLIIKNSKKNVKLSSFKPKTKIIGNIETKDVKVEIQKENKSKNIRTYPKKILTAGYEFLIGRKVGQNIYTDNKQLIAKKQSKITSQIIDVASQNGKLKELTTSSVI